MNERNALFIAVGYELNLTGGNSVMQGVLLLNAVLTGMTSSSVAAHRAVQ